MHRYRYCSGYRVDTDKWLDRVSLTGQYIKLNYLMLNFIILIINNSPVNLYWCIYLLHFVYGLPIINLRQVSDLYSVSASTQSPGGIGIGTEKVVCISGALCVMYRCGPHED